jgi:hypothetical protein
MLNMTTLSIVKLTRMTLSIISLCIMTLYENNTEHNSKKGFDEF